MSRGYTTFIQKNHLFSINIGKNQKPLDIEHFIALIRRFKSPDEISDTMFRELVDRIVVHEAQGVGNARTLQELPLSSDGGFSVSVNVEGCFANLRRIFIQKILCEKIKKSSLFLLYFGI